MGRDITKSILKIPGRGERGFTLQEILIVVAIAGILTAIAVPRFGTMLRASKEADVKTKLGILRSTLNVYYADNFANFPRGLAGANQATLSNTLVPRYLKSIPDCTVTPHHQPTNLVDNTSDNNFQGADSTCDGQWVYVSNRSNTNWGLLAVECYHTDTKMSVWSGY